MLINMTAHDSTGTNTTKYVAVTGMSHVHTQNSLISAIPSLRFGEYQTAALAIPLDPASQFSKVSSRLLSVISGWIDGST